MENKDNNALSQAASAAKAIHGAAKTGKAIAAAAKGAAVGGPYGAAAGAAAGSSKQIAMLILTIAFLLMLPILFIMMLPTLIFGGGGSKTSTDLNDAAAIQQSISDLTSTIELILSEGVGDVVQRITQDAASSKTEYYEIDNPYGFGKPEGAVTLLAQYCAAKNQSYDTMSAADLEKLLRQNLSGLYSFTTRTEIRMVDDDDPRTPDVVEQKPVIWTIYTVTYTGESYFANTVLRLTDAQKSLAAEYEKNLALFQAG